MEFPAAAFFDELQEKLILALLQFDTTADRFAVSDEIAIDHGAYPVVACGDDGDFLVDW